LLGRQTAQPATAARSVGPHPPLVVIFFDEFPTLSLLDDQGRLDAQRFPNFVRLARDSTWYRNATTPISSTPYAIPSMLSGRYPVRAAAPHYSQYPNNLFTLLAGTYDLRVHESVIQLCPPKDCARASTSKAGLPALLGDSAALLRQIVSSRDTDRNLVTGGFTEPTVKGAADEHNPAPTDTKFRWDRRGDNQPLRFREFVDGLRPSQTPALHFLHLILPHQAFRYLPSGTQYAPRYELLPDGPEMKAFWHERHLLQAQYTDRLLGVAMDALRDSGLYEQATVLVTADHGISFNPATELRLPNKAQANAAEIAWVPLFIKAPGQDTARVDDRNFIHVDLLPTLADYAGVELRGPVDGVSALGPPRKTADKPFYNRVGQPYQLESEREAAVVLRGPRALPYRHKLPRADLVGRAVADLRITDGGPAVTVARAGEFRRVDPASGTLPAIVQGTLPASVPAGREIAIALNGKVGAVALVMPPSTARKHRFAGLISDESLFRPGPNRLELFLVSPDGAGLQRLNAAP
jgi:hypothetical protein